MAKTSDQPVRNSGYALVLNPLELANDEPIEIIPGYIFERANDTQIARIQAFLRSQHPPFSFDVVEALYESEYVETKTEHGTRGEYRPLPRPKWRYNVVRFIDKPNYLLELEQASNISETLLELPHAFLDSGGQIGYSGRVSQFLGAYSYRAAHQAESCTISDIGAAYNEIRAVSDSFPEIRRAIRMLDSLKHLPRDSDYHVLGLFQIVELLVTHNPRLDDRGDSITHQVRSKIPLLSHRFRQPLRYGIYFEERSEFSIWAALYRYRSVIAHGGVPDFSSKELVFLKDARTALTFLREAVKALLRHSLREPQLYRDLREC